MILILTGPIHSGKTSLLKRVARELEDRKIPVDGFLSESVNKGGEILGYDLYDIQNKRSFPFIRKEGENGWEKIGAFVFLPSGLRKAKRIISNHSPSKWLFVDEIGPLELSEKGLWPAFKHTLTVPSQKIICVVRRQILDDFLARIKHPDIHVFDVRMENIFSLILEKLTLLDK